VAVPYSDVLTTTALLWAEAEAAATTVTRVDDSTARLVPVTPANCTPVVACRYVPVMVTVQPPANAHFIGMMDVRLTAAHRVRRCARSQVTGTHV
jgi:hypothetical protein